MILYDPTEKTPIDNLMVDMPSAWGDIPTILTGIINGFGIEKNLALEFGVEYGYSTSALAHFFKKVIGVDSFKGDNFVRESHYEQTKNLLSKWSNVELIPKSYQEYTKDVDNSRYDLIHVDIIHTYQDTYDCGEWSINHSDVVLFHDTESHPEVYKACEDLANKYQLNFYNYPHSYGLGILSKLDLFSKKF